MNSYTIEFSSIHEYDTLKTGITLPVTLRYNSLTIDFEANCLFGCAFEENREAEKKLTNIVNNFHALFNGENFNQIYSEADDELKNKFTKQQFVSYLEVVKNDIGEINKEPLIHINSGLEDEIKRIWSKRTDFSTSQLVNTEKAFYNEDFKFKVNESEAKIVSYEVNKICDKPCTIGVGRK